MSEQIQVSGTVDASPEAVFALLSDPARHTEIDGAGMLRGLASGGPITGVGDTFTMKMNNQILGDYEVECRVTAFEPGRRIGWGPKLVGDFSSVLGNMEPGGQTFTYELEPAESGTRVTQTYDWSEVPDPAFKGILPFLNEDQLAESIQRIGKAAG